MTEKEAIWYLSCFKEWNKDDQWMEEGDMEEFVKCCQKALEEIRQYREIGTIENLKLWI